MADIDVKKSSQSSRDTQSSKSNESALERQRGGTGLSRSRDPFGSFLSPADFFSANPFSLMRRMSEEMDRAFGSSFGHTSGGSSGSWLPAIEVSENNGQLQVHADLPGMKPEDVKVEVANDSLILRGERKSEHEHKIGGAYRSERRYGEFYREIPLPEGVDPEQAKAQFRNGVLEITVPLPQQASNRREIPIQSGESSGATASAAAAGSSSQSSSSQSSSSSKRGPSSEGSAGSSGKTATGT